MNFELIETDKLGGGWKQGVAVVRNNEVYLRSVRNGTDYRVMTATAVEDVGGYRISPDNDRLIRAAIQLAGIYKCIPEEAKDGKGRSYIQLFTASQAKSESNDAFTKEINDIVANFFAIYDGLSVRNSIQSL